ncbi:MAG TPA: membrane-bound lytic murein transglycosylase MltF [Xanthomonadales bacterium]|nr:membrane-bound lytic murein transglycosylase MltF [Xanthomonadales bacterium]
MNRAWTLLSSMVLLPLLYSGNDKPSQLQKVQQRGSMTLLTRNSASSYYFDAHGPTGLEYELVRQFSHYLDVALKVETAETFEHLAEKLANGRGDLIAANLMRTRRRELDFNFGPNYLETQILAITRQGSAKPSGFSDLVGLKLMVIADSGYEDVLQAAQREHPGLEWELRSDVGIEDLLLAVADQAIDATLTESNIFSINRPFYPNLTAAFTVEPAVPHAWAFPHGPDDSLAGQARVFMLQAGQNGRLAALVERFSQPEEHLDQEGMFHFLQRVREDLPALIGVFREAGDAYTIDWRLLAAVGYQESHWDPQATSSTGVRGIMMLTEQTADQLGVDDRLDAAQSIDGGARYIARLRDRLPGRIPEPDRTWMALAAYNLGMAHLRDVRILAQKQGLDADRWVDVSQCFGLLSQEKWYKQTQHGYARGLEAKAFVESVRRYFEILLWMDTRDHPLLITQVL